MLGQEKASRSWVGMRSESKVETRYEDRWSGWQESCNWHSRGPPETQAGRLSSEAHRSTPCVATTSPLCLHPAASHLSSEDHPAPSQCMSLMELTWLRCKGQACDPASQNPPPSLSGQRVVGTGQVTQVSSNSSSPKHLTHLARGLPFCRDC